MRALVTGATGFVGSHLAEALLRQGAEVTALVRSPSKAALLNQLGVRQVRGDLHDRAALIEATRGQDAIFHVAGLVAAHDEAEFRYGNREGTAKLVAAIREALPSRGTAEPPRLVYVSSMAAGGPAPRGRPRQGHEPSAPVTAYGRSKLEGEEVVRGSGLLWTVIRPPMVYGPRDTEVLKVFRLTRTGLVPVFGDGTQELSAIYGPDLAEALVAAATSEAAPGRTYYACHPEVFSSRSFVEAVARVVRPANTRAIRVVPLPPWLARGALTVTGAAARLAGKATILTRDKANEFLQPAWTGDPSPLIRDTGWRPSHGLETGLPATLLWYREQGWL
jgi:nucleoside-diphosphate-sugar epimerase